MSYQLVMQSTDGHERPFTVNKPSMVIGRETTCDVRVPVRSVSQKHCQLVLEEGQLRLLDLKSEAGTYHNGKRVEQVTLAHEDTVTVGPVRFTVRELRDEALGDHGQPEIVIERCPDSLPTSNAAIARVVEG